MIWFTVAVLAAGATWNREAVTLEFPSERWIRINRGDWVHSIRVKVAQEGINTVAIRRAKDDRSEEVHEVRIDLTPPLTRLVTDPPIDQQGGLYYATVETVFKIEASDSLSGIQSVEVARDGKYTWYAGPFRLPRGTHQLRCRVTDAAGNRNEVMVGEMLSAGSVSELQIEIQ